MPFHTTHAVPVEGGVLQVVQGGPAPRDAAGVVLAVHGITASHLAWRPALRALLERSELSVLAPDLRGRGGSAQLPPPAHFGAHVDDLVAVLDAFGVERALLAGHSMGAYVVARIAAEHGSRTAAVVLVDGGMPVKVKEDVNVDETLEKSLGPSLARLGLTFESPEQYVAFWQAHPAFAGGWSDDLDAYVLGDLAGEPGALRSVTSREAVRADGAALLLDEATRNAAARVEAPLHVLRAPRGLLDDDKVMVPDDVLAEFLAVRPQASVELVEDSNHYTILMGAGAPRVAAAIERALVAC
jgi:pimeloyl-ACP methyl ester carboxylesterase